MIYRPQTGSMWDPSVFWHAGLYCASDWLAQTYAWRPGHERLGLLALGAPVTFSELRAYRMTGAGGRM